MFMENHEIMTSAMQKYYSALKSLDDFGWSGNFFDDVSNLDKFFSEFRNITFVIQKALKTEENKKIYKELRDKLLLGDTLKWFINSRNKTTKEKPFELRKELVIDMYLPFGLYTLKDPCLVVNMDSSFGNALDYIRSEFIEKIGLVEVFFTSRIVFYEADETFDLYPKIKDGILQMSKFLEKMKECFFCDCEICHSLNEQIKVLFRNVLCKELNFTNDYTMELRKEIVKGEKGEMYFSAGNSQCIPISELKASLDNPLFKDAKGSLCNLFFRFVSMHTAIFQMQEHDIMPVFMLVYSNQTYRMIPFISTTKATSYRKVIEIISMPDFDKVSAVFYCGAFYAYDMGQLSDISNKPYSERINVAKEEILSFILIAKEGEMAVTLDESRVDDMEYVSEQTKEATWDKTGSSVSHGWLNPIRQRIKSVQ